MCDFNEKVQLEEFQMLSEVEQHRQELQGILGADWKAIIRPNFMLVAYYREGQIVRVVGRTIKAELIEMNHVIVAYPSGSQKFFSLDDERIHYVEDKEDFQWLQI
ncbi:hypothetical protein D3C76_499670 [compost metagenome]